jgi:hypothetical protein
MGTPRARWAHVGLRATCHGTLMSPVGVWYRQRGSSVMPSRLPLQSAG